MKYLLQYILVLNYFLKIKFVLIISPINSDSFDLQAQNLNKIFILIKYPFKQNCRKV